MTTLQTWGETISLSLFDLGERFIYFLPSLVGALIIFFVGLAVSVALGKAIEKMIIVSRIDQIVEKIGLFRRMEESGMKLTVSGVFRELVKWFMVLVFLMASTEVLGLTQVTNFLNSIILYVPNIVVATIILSIAFILGNFVYNLVRSSTRAAGVVSASLLASIVRWAILIFGLLAALVQLGIAVSLVNTIFIGVVAAFSLAIGLAFGLGGKDEAALILKKVRKELLENK